MKDYAVLAHDHVKVDSLEKVLGTAKFAADYKRAYRQLEIEGWIATVPGKGCFVCGQPMADPREELRLLRQFEDTAKKLLAMGYTTRELTEKLTEEENHA